MSNSGAVTLPPLVTGADQKAVNKLEKRQRRKWLMSEDGKRRLYSESLGGIRGVLATGLENHLVLPSQGVPKPSG